MVPPMPRFRLSMAVCVLGSLFSAGLASRAQAAAVWTARSIVLPRGDVAIDFGLGLGHRPIDANRSETGFGLNLELSAGLTNEVELGVRTGFRLDDPGQRTRADRYGRPFETESYGTLYDRTANPEVRVRWAIARGSALELGLDLRAYLPVEDGSHFGLMVGVPLSLRAGALRIDSGLYVPVIFTSPTSTVVSVPVHIWIQATRTLWLGPLFGFQVVSEASRGHNQYPLGFGVGTALARVVDLRMWLMFPDMSQTQAARTFGAGLALQVRFE